MTIREFVNDLWLNCSVTPEPMTVEEAAYDLENWLAEDWELPDGLTSEAIAEILERTCQRTGGCTMTMAEKLRIHREIEEANRKREQDWKEGNKDAV